MAKVTKEQLQQQVTEMTALLQRAWDERYEIMEATCSVGKDWYDNVAKVLNKKVKFKVFANVSFEVEGKPSDDCDEIMKRLYEQARTGKFAAILDGKTIKFEVEDIPDCQEV